MELNLPTGIPIVYELDKNLKPVKPMQFLGDEETVRKAMEAVACRARPRSEGAQTDFYTETLLPACLCLLRPSQPPVTDSMFSSSCSCRWGPVAPILF